MENQEDEFYASHDLFVCDCGDISHQFVISTYKTFGDTSVVVEVRLNRNLPWYKRLIKGLTYIFGIGKPSRFGDYDEVILDKSHIPALKKTIETLEAITNV